MPDAEMNTLSRDQLARRACILCCHCIRNLIFYTGGLNGKEPVYSDQFWITSNGNFLDICILEWCKLFADKNGKHYWKKVVGMQTDFYDGLLSELNISESEFVEYIDKVKDYRDKFIAHLDHENMMHIPQMNVVLSSATYLFNYLRNQEKCNPLFADVPTDAGHLVLTYQEDMDKYL